MNKIESIKKAANIANLAFEHIKSWIKPGMAEITVADEIERLLLEYGAEGLSFDTIVSCEERAADPHAVPTENLIPENCYLMIDFGCKYNGYCSDMTRMIKFGNPNEKLQEMHEIVEEAQKRGLAAVKAGVTAKEIDLACREYITEKEYGEEFKHTTGHGVGKEVHEPPKISYKSEEVIKEGDVITVEPGIYVEGLGGIRIEDMVVVTKDGYTNLSYGKMG